MSYPSIHLLRQIKRLLLWAPGPNQNPRGTYIWDTPPSQKWTQSQREFYPKHLGGRKSWLPWHDTHTCRVSLHCSGRFIHTTTKSGRPCPKSNRHVCLDRKCGRYASHNEKVLSRDPTTWTNHHPENHQSRRHQIPRRPLQSRHQTNHTARPDHPWFPVG